MSDQAEAPSADDATQGLLDTLQSNIGRYVAFALTPILLPLVGAAAVWLQAKIGFDIQQYGGVAGVVGYVVAVVGGLAAVIVTWLRNRGNFERAAVEGVQVQQAARGVVAEGVAGELLSTPLHLSSFPMQPDGPAWVQVSPDRDFGDAAAGDDDA